MMYPNSEEEDSISWKLGVDGNFSIKNPWGSLRIKTTNVEILWGSRFIPKHSALDRLSTKAGQLGGEGLIPFVFFASNKMRELLSESASASVRNRWEHILLDSNIHSHNNIGGDGDVEFASMVQN